MKTNLTLLVLFMTLIGLAQNGINYKAVIKDVNGNVVSNKPVTLKFRIIRNNSTGPQAYRERHETTTDANGIVIVNIGEGIIEYGNFNTINWGNDISFLKTEVSIDGGAYVNIGTEQFKYVPYALAAKNLENPIWLKYNAEVFYNLPNAQVGIGTPTPNAKLHVTSHFSQPALLLESVDDDRARLRFGKFSSNSFWDQISGIRTSDASGTMSFYYNGNNVMTLRGDNKVGINTFNPQATLDVVGDIKTSGEVHTNSTGNANMLPIAYGTIQRDGVIHNGSGNFVVSHPSQGYYFISINGVNTQQSTFLATPVSGHLSYYSHVSGDVIEVSIRNNNSNVINDTFSFVVYKP